jgi:hypothetical protein
MNENDLRTALRTTMTATPEPPPMDAADAVTAGRRAVRRRATLAGAGAATAVVAVAALIAGPGQQWFAGGAGTGPAWDVAGQPSAAPSPTGAANRATPSALPDAGQKTEPSWPTEAPGKPQQDATARSGPRYEQGKRLFERLLAVVPDGYTTPTGTAGDGIPLQDHQAAIEDKSWGYLASVAVARDGRTGRLLAEVHTAGNGLPAGPCDLAREFWGMGGTCEVTTTGGKKVGVVVKPGDDNRLDQWAAYRHPDGIVVYVAQSRMATNGEPGLAELTELPLSVDGLADLAVDPRFHLE